MATEENKIGVQAEFDLKTFEANSKRFDQLLKQTNAEVERIEKRTAQVAKERAAAEERAAKQIEASHKQQTTSFSKTHREFIRFAAAITASVAAVVLAYREMREAATELGDTEAIAQFEASDAALGALRDTVLQAGLEILKAADIIPFLTDRLETLNQIAILAGSAVAGFAAGWAELAKAGKGYGIEDLGRPGVIEELNAIDFNAIQRKVQDAQRAALTNIVAAPTRRKEQDAMQVRIAEYQKLQKKLTELEIKTGESLIEAQQDYQQRSIDAWIDYTRKLEDIDRDAARKRQDLSRDYRLKLADLDRQNADQQEDAARDRDKRLADIERDFQNEIYNIERNYAETRDEAIAARDALALLRANRTRDKDVSDAQRKRDQERAEAEAEYARKLAELQRSLEREREEARRHYEQALAELEINLQRQRDDAALHYSRQRTDVLNNFNQRIADMRTHYQNEYNEQVSAYGNQEQALRNHLTAMRAIMAQYGFGGGGGETVSPRRRAGGGFQRAEGGVDVVDGATNFTVGEAGPEVMVTAPLAGRMLPAPTSVNHIVSGSVTQQVEGIIQRSYEGYEGRIASLFGRMLREVFG